MERKYLTVFKAKHFSMLEGFSPADVTLDTLRLIPNFI